MRVNHACHISKMRRVGCKFSPGRHTCLPAFASFFFGISVELLEKMEIKVYNESRMTLSGELRAA